MRASNILTELAVKKAKKTGRLSDGQAMYLLVHKNGSKYWRLDYKSPLDKQRKTLALGTWPEVSLTEARKRRDEARALLREKIDPVQNKRGQELKRRVKHGPSFSQVMEEWIKRKARRWTEKHTFDVRRSFANHILPYLGERPIAAIDRREVIYVLRLLEDVGKYEAAHRARQRIEAVIDYAVISGDCTTNPAHGLGKILTPPKKKPMPALKANELPEFFRKLENYDGHRLTRLALDLIILVFVRTSELRHAEWTEFDLAAANPTWVIPPEKMKMGREHVVPLSRQALEILRQVAEISGDEKLVFPGQQNPNRPMSENTMLYALYRMGYHKRATVHGFRSTASTILNDSGRWHPDSIERQLAHVEENKTRASYDRSEHLAERRQMLQFWADHIDSLKQPADVIELERFRQ